MKETTYINGGDTYKESISRERIPGVRVVATSLSSSGIKSNYWHYLDRSRELDALFQLKSSKTMPDGTVKEKMYHSTAQLRKLIGIDGGVDLSTYDISPDINLVMATGVYEDEPTFSEFYFNAESFEQLEKVAKYYGLNNPITEASNFNVTREDWILRKYKSLDGSSLDIVAASIAFENGTPTKFKLYQSGKE